MFKFRRNKYNINSKAANEALQNVFAACEQEPNNTPLEVIRMWSVANLAIVKIGLWMSLALLVIILIMPLAFVNQGQKSDRNKAQTISVTEHYLDTESNEFVMVLAGSGIDYYGVYAKDSKGEVVFPSAVDPEAHTVRIPFEEGNLNIFVPKMDGTIMQAVLSK